MTGRRQGKIGGGLEAVSKVCCGFACGAGLAVSLVAGGAVAFTIQDSLSVVEGSGLVLSLAAFGVIAGLGIGLVAKMTLAALRGPQWHKTPPR